MSTIAQPAAVPPTAPRRGGRRGGGSGFSRGGKSSSVINAAAAQPDDTEEVRKLRAKYADKLGLLREMFPDWTDEDLLFSLQEAGGEMELVVGRISEGHAEQFSSVKSKKQVKKDTGSTATPSTFQGTAAPSIAAGTGVATRRGASAGTRGCRGGATSIRRARGGRGGLRGSSTGRGGAAIPVDGHSGSSTTKATPSGVTWADAVAATSPTKSNGVPGGDWGDDTEGLDLKTAAAPAIASKAGGNDGAHANGKIPVETLEHPESVPTVSATAAATSHEEEEPGKLTSALAKIIPAKLIPKGSKMSWAQVARPAEPVKPTISEPVAVNRPAPTAPASQRVKEPEKEAEVVPPVKEESTDVAAAAADSTETAANPPPGLNNTFGAESGVALSTVAATTTAAASKPVIGRSAQSQRTIQRAKQQEAVVMAGNNTQYDNLGVKFGSLNFLGGEDNDAQTEEATTAVPAATTTTESNVGSTAAPALTRSTAEVGNESALFGDRFGQNTQSSAPLHVQQQTQTTPTHQDAFAQASSSPYNTSKTEAQNVHQYGYQHHQAHQAAVAQAHQQIPQQASTTTTQHDHQQQQYQQQSEAGGVASGGFGALTGQQQQQQQQPLNSQYGDYYANLDSQRLSSFYGNYDQSALSLRGNEERTASQPAQQQQQQQQQQAASNDGQHHHQSHPSATQQGTPQQQQQFPNVMPYYYPHYYLPNQFQHYGQPGTGYGQQYALYGQQQQHPSKPTTPASLQTPYSQNVPGDLSGSGQYGNSGGVGAGQYGQSPAVSSLTAAGTGYGDGGINRQGASASSNDYSKLYGNMATPASTHSSSIPGLGGFLGQSPAPSNGNVSAPQSKNGTALENAYRQYDNGKVSPAQQQPQHQQQAQQASQVGQQAGGQQQQQRQQPSGATPQQQQYYQQYNAYAGHQQQQQQPSGASGNYGNYPYRQYWG